MRSMKNGSKTTNCACSVMNVVCKKNKRLSINRFINFNFLLRKNKLLNFKIPNQNIRDLKKSTLLLDNIPLSIF